MDSYLYPTASVKSREKKLFDQNDLERMIDAENIDRSFKIFNELSYADELLDMESPLQYREVLAHDLKQVKEYIASISPDDRLNELIFAQYDFHNLKIIFKAKSIDKEPENLLEIKAISIDEYNKITKQAEIDLKKASNSYKIESYFDKIYFSFILEKAKKIKDKFLINLVKKQIDIANLKIILRSKLLERDFEEMSESIIISNLNIQEDYNKDLNALINKLKIIFSENKIDEILNNFLEKKDYYNLEKNLDNYLISLIKNNKMSSESPSVLACYILAKKNAIKNIRIIMSGKINGIKSEEIKERVRELY